MAKKTTEKVIRIACEGASTISINDLVPLQDDLKILPEESYQKLRMSLIELGFSFPIQAWKNKGKTYIIDAHQRVSAMKKMRDEEGFKIPPLPVSWVYASSVKEAALKLLAAASQYGEVTNEGLFDFLKKIDVDFTKLSSSFQFPEVNLDIFRKRFFPNEKQVSFTAKDEWVDMPEYEQGDKTSFRHIIVHFDNNEDVNKFFKMIGQKCTESTKSIWFPYKEPMDTESKRYG